MSLIYGVPEMAEEEVLEQIAFQAVQYLRLDDPKYKKADTLSKILVAAKDKPKRMKSYILKHSNLLLERMVPTKIWEMQKL